MFDLLYLSILGRITATVWRQLLRLPTRQDGVENRDKVYRQENLTLNVVLVVVLVLESKAL